MQFFTSSDYVDVDLYEDRLNRTGEIYADLQAIGMYSQQQACKAATLHRLCLKHMNLHSKLGYSALTSSAVVDFLQRTERIDPKNFRKKNVAGESLDKKKVLIPLLKNGYAPDFLSMFIEHQECRSRSQNMSMLYRRCYTEDTVRGWTEMLTPIPFTARRSVNLRFNYRQENLISFPSDMHSVIKARENYVLAWGDFAQSDARIAYNLLLRDETNIKYIKKFPDDVYAGFANWVREFQKQELEHQLAKAIKFRDDVFNESGQVGGESEIESCREKLKEWEPFTGFKNKSERDLYKVYVLETIYGTRHHRVAAAANFIRTLGKVLDACPKYKQFWDDVTKRASFGVPVKLQCYMGNVEHVAAFDGARLKETLFKCLNYPVQSGTSEIIILTVNRILDKFYSLGYTEDDVHVYYIRHDEPIFEMKKTVLKDSWVLKDFATIQVDDWIPLRLDFSFGRTYGEEDQDLTESFVLSEKINKHLIGVCTPQAPKKEYRPLENLLEVAIHVETLSDNRRLWTLYNVNDGTYVVRSIEATNSMDNTSLTRALIDKYAQKVHNAGYPQMVVYNNDYYEDDWSGTVPLVRLYRISTNTSVFRAMVIALAARAALEGTRPSIVSQNNDFLRSLKKCCVFGGDELESTSPDIKQA